MSSKSSRFYTLIEILIAVMLLVILLGAVGINIRAASKDQTFQAEVDHLLHRLNLAQDMLVVLKIDSRMEFKKDAARWFPIGNINQNYEILIDREKIPLSEFSEITFEDSKESKKEGEFTLNFGDLGYIMPQGVLKLVSKRGKTVYINFPGYPQPLTLAREAPNERELDRKEREFYEQITRFTFEDPYVSHN